MRSYKIEPLRYENGRHGWQVIPLDGATEVQRVHFDNDPSEDGDSARAECESVGEHWVENGINPYPRSLFVS